MVKKGRFSMAEKFLFNRAAFTLAEVLITLGVIGVVAAMTIPQLMSAYKAHKLRTQFLKSYSTVQQAFKQMEANDESTDPSSYGGRSFYRTIMKYFNGAKNCADNRTLTCYPFDGGYKSLDGCPITDYMFDDGQIALLDGTLLMFEDSGIQGQGTSVLVTVDINGYLAPPNRWGVDLFTFQLVDGALVVAGDLKSSYKDPDAYCDITKKSGMNGLTCAYKAKNDSDYFKHIIKIAK